MEPAADKEMLLDDRRDALRQPTPALPLTVEHQELGNHEGCIVDVSRRGLRFRSRFCFPCGGRILLYPPTGTDLRPVRARIMRVQVIEERDGTYFECGVQYTDEAEIRRHTWFLSLRAAA